jgi:hypothetical protein
MVFLDAPREAYDLHENDGLNGFDKLKLCDAKEERKHGKGTRMMRVSSKRAKEGWIVLGNLTTDLRLTRRRSQRVLIIWG